MPLYKKSNKFLKFFHIVVTYQTKLKYELSIKQKSLNAFQPLK